MPVITLLTDFGLEDEYVGVMKGVILSIQPQAVIVDITHQIPPHQVVQAAQTLDASYRYFPEGTVHVAVVDPGVGTERRIIALRKAGCDFVAPDNGVLTALIETGDVDAIVCVENERLFLKPVSRTFHGRDIFAPVAAHLSKGMPLEQLGRELLPEQVARIEMPRAQISAQGEIHGRIVAIDRFGNLITDIDGRMLEKLKPGAAGARWIFHFHERSIAGLSTGYAAVDTGVPLALIGSRKRLEIAVCRGSAQSAFGATIGDPVRVSVD